MERRGGEESLFFTLRLSFVSFSFIPLAIQSTPLSNPVSGVIGLKAPKYSVFGDTVNTASRMATSQPGPGIQLSESTLRLVGTLTHSLSHRGKRTNRLAQMGRVVSREGIMEREGGGGREGERERE